MKPKPLYVVGVCSGNIQRSPTFEAVMDYSLYKEHPDLEGRVIITSAGTNVERSLTNSEEPTRVIKLLKAALEYGIVPEYLKPEAEYYAALCNNKEAIDGLSEADTEKLRFLHQAVRPELSYLNVAYRDEALKMRGIDPSMLISGKPLRPEQGYNIIIAMEDIVLGKVKERYNDAETGQQTEIEKRVVDIPGRRIVVTGTEIVIVPQITTYDKFTGRDPVIENASGGLKGVLAHVDYFIDTREEFFEQIGRLAR